MVAIGELTRRVRNEISLHFNGSVNAAAHRWGIPQRTLARFVAGESSDPRHSLVMRLTEVVAEYRPLPGIPCS